MINNYNLSNNDFQISANAVFQTLDAKDGNADGKINVSIWNEFADKVGGKHIKNYITEQNAIKSISAYLKRGGEAVKQIILNYLGWSTDKAQERLNAADKLLEEVANDSSNIEITKDKNGNKKATLKDGRYIEVFYDESGNIKSIHVSTEVGENIIKTPNDSEKKDDKEVGFKADGAHADGETTNQRNYKYEITVTEGYDFEKYKQIAEKIFGSTYDE